MKQLAFRKIQHLLMVMLGCAALTCCSGMSGSSGGTAPGPGGAVGEAPGGGSITTGGGSGGSGSSGGAALPISGPVAAASGGILSAPIEDEKLGDDCVNGKLTTVTLHRLMQGSPPQIVETGTAFMTKAVPSLEGAYLLQQGEAQARCLAEAWDFSRYVWTDQGTGANVRVVVEHTTVIPPPPEPDTGGLKFVKSPEIKLSHRYQDLTVTDKNSEGNNLSVSLPVANGDRVHFYFYGSVMPLNYSATLSAELDGVYAPEASGEGMVTLTIYNIPPIKVDMPDFF